MTAYSPEVNAHLWRDHRRITGRLRCGILLDGAGGVERWAADILQLLRCEPAIALESIYLLPAADARANPPKSALFERLYRWSERTASPMERIDLRASEVGATIEPSRGDGEIRARMAAADLDVLIWLESTPLELDCQGLARFGVWSFRCGDPDERLSYPAYWREVAQGREFSTIALESDSGDGQLRRLAVCQVSTQQGVHLTKNAVEPLALAGPMLMRSLLDVLERNALCDLPAEQTERQTLFLPGNWHTATLIARQAGYSAQTRFAGRGRGVKWFVALRNKRELFRANRDRFEPLGLREVASPGGSQFADPMVVDHEGRHWLFVEEIPAGTSKGRLAVVELDSEGNPGQPVTILERDYHLSYPFVFRSGAEFFMIPETSANNNIELHRAVRFPLEWKLEKVLCANVRAVDTTPLFLDGIWYFFTTSGRIGHETFLFWSETLDGKWNYHPCNPICSDVRRARGAGAFFYSGGALIRPAQDCSVRYGYAVALNRVLKLSTTEYAEELIETITPTWRKGLLATHTLSSNDSFEAVDGLRFSR